MVACFVRRTLHSSFEAGMGIYIEIAELFPVIVEVLRCDANHYVRRCYGRPETRAEVVFDGAGCIIPAAGQSNSFSDSTGNVPSYKPVSTFRRFVNAVRRHAASSLLGATGLSALSHAASASGPSGGPPCCRPRRLGQQYSSRRSHITQTPALTRRKPNAVRCPFTCGARALSQVDDYVYRHLTLNGSQP